MGATASLSPDDAREILTHFDLGQLVSLDELTIQAHNAPYYRLTTTRGRFFLKRFLTFLPTTDRGLELILFLRDRGYPAIQVHRSTHGGPRVRHGDHEIALFEYLDLSDDRSVTRRRAAALGDALGRLHTIARDFPLPPTLVTHHYFTRRFEALPALEWMPAEAQDTLAWVTHTFAGLDAPPDAPRGVCHVEFVMEHAAFFGDQLHRIFDWDLVGVGPLFHDLGTTLSQAVSPTHVDFGCLAAALRSYEAHRPLSPWEREHVCEATCFGISKFLIWSMGRTMAGPSDLPHRGFAKVAVLRALGKAGFDAALAEALR
ncbi:MAG TPA: phosphotransferase [Chloroflexota bacterium]|nr:phosphotransferase [Chloroflexota bacterium]